MDKTSYALGMGIGRQLKDMGADKLNLDDFAQALADVAVVDKAPKVEGRSMTMFLAEKR